MTKTTSYEISKELEEIGFKAKHSFIRFAEGSCEFAHVDLYCDNYRPFRKSAKVPSYDLETILDALPKVIGNFRYWSTWSSSSDCYIFGYVDGINRSPNLETYTEAGESLADTAARLLITLIKDKIVEINT
mgnify:CR=1 FL=1